MKTNKYKMKLSERIKYIAHNIKSWFENFLLDEIALPIIRNQAKDSPFISHFRYELKLAHKGKESCGIDKLMEEQVCDLLALLSTQGDSGFSIGLKKHYFTKAMMFEILSPLTFEDYEFGNDYGGDALQNVRDSSVFKDKNSGEVSDIDSFSKRTSLQYNIDTKELQKGNNLTWSGAVMVYDDIDTHKWFGVSRGVIRPDNKHYYGDNKVVVPCIEVVDNHCDRGTFLFSITKKSSFPKKFFKDYILVPVDKPWVEEDRKMICEIPGREHEFIEALNKLPKEEEE